MEVEVGVVPDSVDGLSSKDQVSWAQCWLESSYFDSLSFDSPKGCFSPKLAAELQQAGLGAFPSDFCPSPQLSEQLQLLQSWSTRTPSKHEAVSTTSSVSCSGSEASHSALIGSDLTMESDRNHVQKKLSRKRKSTTSNDDGSLAELEKDSLQTTKTAKKQKRTKGPRYAIKTRSEVDIMEDGYKWRKYGQKPVKSSPHPRNYYRCTTANCPVRKRVERCMEDTGQVITSYEGTHSHPRVIQQKNGTNSSGSVSTNQPPVPNLSHLWGSGLNFPGWPPAAAPSSHDNMNLIMAYQLVKLQWELQARTQEFMDFSCQTYAAEMMEPVQQSPRKGDSSPMGSSLLRKRASAFRHGAGPNPLDLQSIAKMQHHWAAQQMADHAPA